MAQALRRYFDYHIDRTTPPEAFQLALLISYFQYFIHAPCWQRAPQFPDCLDYLRARSLRITTIEEIADWLFMALMTGYDPLVQHDDAQRKEGASPQWREHAQDAHSSPVQDTASPY